MGTHYGGQALIEGVLMRGRAGVYAAVRAPDGRLVTRQERLPLHRQGPARLPVIRGILALRDTVAVGSHMLLFSADVAAGGSGEDISSPGKRAAVGAGIFGAVAFTILPDLLASLLRRGVPDDGKRGGLVGSLFEGSIRFGLLMGYLGVIGRLPDVQRIFAYHGAEHKAIHALEAGEPLMPAAVQQFDTPHPRCGTAFLLQSMLTSTALYALIGKRAPLGRIGTRLALLPLVVGTSYEVLQFSARHLDFPLVRAMTVPGMLLQRLTTRQPTDDQVEVAIRALQGAIAMDEEAERE
jgi:uncharacterized protein YqhQ